MKIEFIGQITKEFAWGTDTFKALITAHTEDEDGPLIVDYWSPVGADEVRYYDKGSSW